MPDAIRFENGRRVIVEATADDVPADHPIAVAARREAMVVSRFQAKAALSAAGLLPQVETAIAAADPVAQLAWSEAIEFKRNSPTIVGLAATIGLTETQVDDLFRTAAGIEA